RSHGIGRKDCVGLLLPRSLDVYVALLAILKAEAAYVPLDPEYPADRVAFILADCGARGLVTVTGLTGKAEHFAGTVIELAKQRTGIDAFATDRLGHDENQLTPEDLCYIIYTSG